MTNDSDLINNPRGLGPARWHPHTEKVWHTDIEPDPECLRLRDCDGAGAIYAQVAPLKDRWHAQAWPDVGFLIDLGTFDDRTEATAAAEKIVNKELRLAVVRRFIRQKGLDGMSDRKATHLGQVMTAAELDELVVKIRELMGDDIQARARAIACGWPLGAGPTMSDDIAKRRQQKGLQ